MKSTSDIHAAEIKRLEKELDTLDIKNNDDVRAFLTLLTKLVYDYKMIGKLYEYYAPDVEYHKQNKVVFKNIEDVVRNVAEFCAAFPNLRTNIEHIIVYKQDDGFYKASKRLHYWGNNYGVSKYGPPTGKSLANNCLSMSLLYLKKIDGKWKITFEINSDSEEWLEEVQTGAAAAPPELEPQPLYPPELEEVLAEA